MATSVHYQAVNSNLKIKFQSFNQNLGNKTKNWHLLLTFSLTDQITQDYEEFFIAVIDALKVYDKSFEYFKISDFNPPNNRPIVFLKLNSDPSTEYSFEEVEQLSNKICDFLLGFQGISRINYSVYTTGSNYESVD